MVVVCGGYVAVVEVDVLVPCSPLMVMHDDADTGVDCCDVDLEN